MTPSTLVRPLAVTALCLAASAAIGAADGMRLRPVASVYVDDKGGSLNLPEGVACGGGQVLVADTGNGRLVRYMSKDEVLSGGTELKIAELPAPTTLHLGSKGDIYALDGTAHRIVQLAADGTFKAVVKITGAPPPATILPRSFTIGPGDALYVLDAVAARVLVLDTAGQFQKALALPDDARSASDVTVDEGSTLYVLDAIGRRVYTAAKDASAFTALGSDLKAMLPTLPTFIRAYKGTLFVGEGLGGRVVVLGRDGTFLSRQLGPGRAEGLLMHPAQLCVSQGEQVFVADRDNSRVQVFGLAR